MNFKCLLPALFCILLRSHSIEMLLEISVDEVYCEACIASMKKKSLTGIKKVSDYTKPATAMFELKSDVDLKETFKALKDNNYTVRKSWLLVRDAKLDETPAGPMIKTASQSICTKDISQADLDTKPWFRGELLLEDNLFCLKPALPLEAQ